MSDRDLNDNLTGEQSPSYNAVEAEKAVLALCMRNREALESSVMKRLVAGDFLDKKHSLIFDAISELYVEGSQINRFTVCEKLTSKGNNDKAGGDQYVFTVANTQSVMSALDSYVDIVLKNCQSRKLLATLKELEQAAEKRENSVNDIVDLSIGKLSLLKTKEDTTGFESLGVILRRNLEELREASFGKGDRKVIKTGFSYLDQITGGFKPGTINIIAARPGMGKTALVLNIATNVAQFYSKTVAIFSLEMSKSEVANRILASTSHTNYKSIERANITREDEEDIVNTLSTISDFPIYIDEKTNTNPTDIMSKCQELEREHSLGLVIIDYLQLLTIPGKSNGNRQNEIAEISRSLKVLAKELKVPVIALSQLNRGTENREDGDHIPGLADIRDSGAIEQDADCVIFIHRPSYYTKKKDAAEKPKIEDAQLIVAKNRHGETDTAYVKWYGAKALFFEAPRKGDPEDPMGGSAYTRTVPSDASSADYNFEEPSDIPSAPFPDVPPEDYGDPGPSEPQGYSDSEDSMDQSNNEAFFSDSHDDLPEGFL